MKKLRLVLAIMALTSLSLPASAESHGYTCGVTGAATFKPGVTAQPGDFKIAFKGELNDCQSTGEASSAKVVATAKAEATSCAFGGVTGKGKITWDDGKRTSFTFETTDIAAVVLLNGEVTKSNDDVAREGDDTFAVLFFNADPTACNSDEGLTRVEFQGQTGGGSPS